MFYSARDLVRYVMFRTQGRSPVHHVNCSYVVSARKMHFVFRTASCAIFRRSFLLKTGPVVPPSSSLSCTKQLCVRLSSTAGHKPTAKNQTKTGANILTKSRFSSIHPLPTPPLPPKGTPPTISTHDIEQYIQPLYARGWGLSLSPILPNGDSIIVLRKRFGFTNADALEGFLADLSEYEEKKQVRSSFYFNFSTCYSSPSGPI